jgi:exosortase
VLTVIYQNRIALAKAAAIVVATIVLFAQDLTILFNDALLSETTSYILAIPLIFVYLVYRKRKMLKAATALEPSEPRTTQRVILIAGILLSTLAVMLYWYGSYTFTPLEYHVAALPLFAAGLTLIIFNPQTLRQLAFPIVFLAFLIPPPEETLYAIGSTLSTVSAVAANSIMNVFGIPSTLSDELGSPLITITRADGTPMAFGVDIACSGIYSLIGFAIFAVFIAYVIRDKLWKKLALLIIGFPLVYLLNIIRITTMLLIGYQFGEQLALDVFHTLGGWVLIFAGTLLLLFISEKAFKTHIFDSTSEKCSKCSLPSRPKGDFCMNCGRIIRVPKHRLSKNDVVKIIAIAMCVTLLLSIQAPVFALTQIAGIDINTPKGQVPSTQILPTTIGEYNLDPNFTYRDTAFEETSKQDMSIVYLYTGTSKEPLFVAMEIASAKSLLHRWETCLITYRLQKGWELKVRQIELRDTMLKDNPPIIGRFFVFQYISTNETQVVLYWYETATFKVNSTSQQKYVKFSVEAFPTDTENLQALEDEMLFVARKIVDHWEPIKLWSQITLLLSLNGDKLVTATGVILVIVIILHVLERRRRRKTNYQAYQKLSEPNKQIINIIHETGKAPKHKWGRIAAAYKKVAAKLTPEWKTLPPLLMTSIESLKAKTNSLLQLLLSKTEKTPPSTLLNIATTYRRIARKTIRKQKLLEELQQLENTGFINSTISNMQDEPIQTWKTQIAFPKKT